MNRLLRLSKALNVVRQSTVNFSVVRNCTTQVKQNEEEAVVDDLFQGNVPQYDKVPEFWGKAPKPRRENYEPRQKPEKQEDVIISCRRKELNHYMNQVYDKFKPIPLASKGWTRRQSNGDYFTMKVCDNEEYINNLFWNAEGKSFIELGIDQRIIDMLKLIGINHPTKIQELSIPVLLSGKNSLVTAETGCGKTLAYLIPLLEQILRWKSKLPTELPMNSPLGLILMPSRELALQVGGIARQISHGLPVNCNTLIGGHTKRKMMNPNFEPIDLQIATIGAFSKMVSTGLYDVTTVKHVVVDEADTMLDDSFNELLIRNISKMKIRYGPNPTDFGTQMTLVSATMPTSVYSILDGIVEPDSLVKVSTSRVHQVLPHVEQTFYKLSRSEKPVKLLKLVKQALNHKQPVLIFSNKSPTCDWISMMLNENGVPTLHLNGQMPEIVRRDKFEKFQNGEFSVLSCTDIASRGLDTTRVKHVINYDFPAFMADYIHRCGRTGRVGSDSKSKVSHFVTSDQDVKLVQSIEMAVRTMTALHNVNGNITKIIQHRLEKIAAGESN